MDLEEKAMALLDENLDSIAMVNLKKDKQFAHERKLINNLSRRDLNANQ